MKSLILIVCLALTSLSFAAELLTGNTLVEVDTTTKSSVTYINGDAAKALYENMTDVDTVVEDRTEGKFSTRKGVALECSEDIYKDKTNYICIISISSDGSASLYNPEKVCEYPAPVDSAN